MLVISRVRGGVGRPKDDDSGAILVTVVVVMLVGFIIAATIAASVVFTIGANDRNRDRTEAFIAAESGRDAMLASLMAHPCQLNIADSADPAFKSVTAKVGMDIDHLTDTCLSTTKGATIEITSTGVSPAGNTTVVSVYQRLATYSNQPGGSLSYFAGTFKLTQSTYKGDIVVRDGDYECNSASTIDGDLWVPHGGVYISAKCDVTGNIYARDDIEITGSQEQVGTVGKAGTGDIVSQNGPITLQASNSLVTGNLLSGGVITVDSGTVNGNAHAATSVDTKPQGKVLGTTKFPLSPSPAVFSPALEDVYEMTNWLDIGPDTNLWGGDVQWVKVPSGSCTANQTSQFSVPLTGSNTRYGFDYSECTANVTVTLGAGNIKHDAVFLVRAGVNMTVDITGALTSTGAAKTPQLFFIHADLDPSSAGPGCHSGATPSDKLDLPNGAVAPYLMIYSPCGMDKHSVPTNKSFVGQFYSADNTPLGHESHWVQPDFICQPMSWTPLIKLSCFIKDAGTGENGTIETTLQPSSFLRQTETAK